MDRAFIKSAIVVKWNYVTPVHAAQKIRIMRHTCTTGPYLDCVLEYAEVSRLSEEFARLHEMPEIADPDIFLHTFDEMHLVFAEDAPESG